MATIQKTLAYEVTHYPNSVSLTAAQAQTVINGVPATKLVKVVPFTTDGKRKILVVSSA